MLILITVSDTNSAHPLPHSPTHPLTHCTDGSTAFQKDGMSDKSPLQMLAQTCSQIGADPGDDQENIFTTRQLLDLIF